jgi:Cu2+-exporting ATPase
MVSCPCALALATPTTLTSAANALRSRGVVVAGENALESLSRCTHLVLDKTGTLTEGEPTLAQVQPLGGMNRADILSTAAALQQYSSHPLASAFTAIDGTAGFQAVGYRVGRGLEGSLAGVNFRIGSLAYCRELAPQFPAPPGEDLYWIGLCREGEALAWIGLDDKVRPEAKALVANARDLRLQVELLTGDSSPRGPQLANALGIETVATGQTPEQKMQHIEQLQRAGATVVMVGDGLNDAPVLALADASFAVSSATDLARSQADFIIVEDGLDRIVETLRKARRCRIIIRENFAWALAYNLGAMPLAALGYVPPWAAAIGMSASSLLVLMNSLRLAGSPGGQG